MELRHRGSFRSGLKLDTNILNVTYPSVRDGTPARMGPQCGRAEHCQRRSTAQKIYGFQHCRYGLDERKDEGMNQADEMPPPSHGSDSEL
jgi:hypothetical protein